MAKLQKKRKYKLYMLVTNDIYELPMSVPMNVYEMAALTGLKPESIYWMCTPSAERRLKGRKGYSSSKKWRIVSWYDEEGLLDDPE